MPAFDDANSAYNAPRVVGKIASKDIEESSGLASSQCQPNVLWTINDSGDGPFIYAMSLTGEELAVWKVAGAKNDDWEDMALVKNSDGQCYLYLADTGNGDKLEKSEMTIYRVKEPTVGAADKNSKKDAPSTAAAEVLKFRYPDGNHDSESLVVHPVTGDIYVLLKVRTGPSAVYKIKAEFSSGQVGTATKLTDLTVPVIPNGFLTGANISPDARRVIICDYAAAYELVLPEGVTSFDDIWREKPVAIPLGERKQGEAIAYRADGKALFATSERAGAPVIEVDRK